MSLKTDPEQDRVCKIAGGLLGQGVDSAERLAGGRNSRVYCLCRADRGFCVAKHYPLVSQDPRDRLGTEYKGLAFLRRAGFGDVPQPLASEPAAGMALYEYVEGRPAEVCDPDFRDLEQVIDFVHRLDLAKNLPEARGLPLASEACFSGRQLLASLGQRVDRLKAVPCQSEPQQEMHRFLQSELLPALASFREWAERRLQQGAGGMERELALRERTLSPSDFGFHNAVRRPDGSLVFLDFEYFGWDDPVKLVSDFVLHPGMQLSLAWKSGFLDSLCGHFGREEAFGPRLSGLYPLWGIKWCCILLNEFIPADRSRRNFAENNPLDNDRLCGQLAKARAKLKEVIANHERFPKLS